MIVFGYVWTGVMAMFIIVCLGYGVVTIAKDVAVYRRLVNKKRGSVKCAPYNWEEENE
jgi:hypothetical protein